MPTKPNLHKVEARLDHSNKGEVSLDGFKIKGLRDVKIDSSFNEAIIVTISFVPGSVYVEPANEAKENA